MARLVWTLPDGETTARWTVDEGGGGGSQDLAQVLAQGGDPDGNPITGRLIVSIDDPDQNLMNVTGGLDGNARFDVQNDGSTSIRTTGEDFDDAFKVVRAGTPMLVVGPTGAVTISPSDPGETVLTLEASTGGANEGQNLINFNNAELGGGFGWIDCFGGFHMQAKDDSSQFVYTARLGTNLLEMTGDGKIGAFGHAPVARPTGVAVTAAGIHAALASLGWITA